MKDKIASNSVRDQTMKDKVRDQARWNAMDQICWKIRYQVIDQIRDQVCNRTLHHVWFNSWDQLSKNMPIKSGNL
jgi:hypothetical protein